MTIGNVCLFHPVDSQRLLCKLQPLHKIIVAIEWLWNGDTHGMVVPGKNLSEPHGKKHSQYYGNIRVMQPLWYGAPGPWYDVTSQYIFYV